MTTKEFIKKLKKIFKDDNYSYVKTKFYDYHMKVIIACPFHGDFLVEPTNALHHKSGCPLCRNKKISKSKTYTTKQFIEKAKEIHGERYDYSLVDYVNSKKKIKIVCPIHGVFEQTPNGHLRGYNCPLCARGREQAPSLQDC